MFEDLQLRNYSEQTTRAYRRGVADFAKHFGTSTEHLGPEQVRTYQLFLVQDKQLAWSTVVQTVCALRFFYTVTLRRPMMLEYIASPQRPLTLPIILSQAEVATLLTTPRTLKHRAILTTLYAAGLRVSELCQLQVTAIDSTRMVLRVRQGKGQQDRYVMLSPKLLPLLRQYWRQDKPQPWLFPGHPRTCPITTKAVYLVCRRAGQAAHLPKLIPPHLLRHAFGWCPSTPVMELIPTWKQVLDCVQLIQECCRDAVGQQFVGRPDMIGQACRHRGGHRAPLAWRTDTSCGFRRRQGCL
jgi:site-specific recombinase XerD